MFATCSDALPPAAHDSPSARVFLVSSFLPCGAEIFINVALLPADGHEHTRAHSTTVVRDDGMVPLWLHFFVMDTGIGIPADRMDRLFKSFSQIDVATTRTYGGTGLGLAISLRLVECMSGIMWVESECTADRHGSTFHFIIQVGSGRTRKVGGPKQAAYQAAAALLCYFV